jgi:hypothetical protein
LHAGEFAARAVRIKSRAGGIGHPKFSAVGATSL